MCKAAQSTACIFNIQKFSIHDGPGIRTAVFFQGCPLRCKWCANPESQAFGEQVEREQIPTGKNHTMDEVLAACLADEAFYQESGGGVTLTGGEVLSQADFASELLVALRHRGIHTALETTGFAPRDIFDRIAGKADLLLYDLKHYDGQKHLEGTGVCNDRILQNLQAAAEQGMDILLRIPVIPGYNDRPEDARGFAAAIRRLGLRRVQLLPFHQFGQKKYEILGMPYPLGHLKALRTGDLSAFLEILRGQGLECFV